MVAIFTGSGAGFARGSGNLLGGAGQLGSSLLGRAGESVSVNAATGNLLVGHQDEFLVGLGPDVAIARSYNSLQDAGDGDNGDHWQQSTTRKVFGLTGTLGTAGSTISRLGADGAVIVYAWDGSRSAYLSKDGAGAFDTLVKSGAEWVWTDGDTQAKEYYQAAIASGEYRIRSSQDIDGNALSFTYVSGSDRLDKVTTADGSWTQYSWSGNNITQVATGYTDLVTSSARTLTRVRYGYDGSNRLTSVTTDLTPGDNSVSDNNKYVVTYSYDGSSNRIATIGQTDGSLLSVTYDGSGRVATLTQTVASGVTRVTTLTYGTGYTTITGPDGQATRLDYDASKRLTRITAPAAYSGASAQTVQFAYDADGNLDSVTDGNGKVTSYDYDANGNATLVTDATGHTVTRTYDAQNRLITELTSGADRDGASVAHYRQYVYDAEGHLRFAVNAAGQTSEYQYSTDGKLVRTIDYAEQRMTPPGASAIDLTTAETWAAAIADRSSVRVVDNSYDARGNLTQSRAYGIADTSGNPLSTEGTSTTSFVYDQAGNLIDRYRPGENHETFLYDGMGRLYSSTDRNGGTTTIVFADATTTTAVTTALGLTTTSVYDKAGELVGYTESGASTTAGTATYQYDAAGRLRVATDATGRSSYIYYDKAGRKVAEIDQLGEVTEYRYDAAGRIAATTTYANALAAGSLATIANPAATAEFPALRPTASASDIWSWTIYDDAGRVIQAIDNLGSTVTYEYDAEGKLAKTCAYFNKLSAATLSGFKAALPTTLQLPAAHARDTFSRVFYNKAGQQIAALDGEGYLTESIRDGAGLVTQTTAYVAATVAGDRASASLATLKAGIATSNADRVARSVYDGQGLLRYTLDAKGGVTGYAYDNAGRLVATTAYATQVALTDFTYDAVKAAVVTNAADRTSRVVYDAAGRAAYTLDAEGGVTAFAYNAAGLAVKAIAYDNLYASSVDLASLNAWSANTAQANDTANRVTRSWYNARGEVLYSLDAENYVTGYAYDAQGRALSTTRYGGSGVTVGDSTTIAQLAALLTGAPTSGAITVSQTYDNAGRVLTLTDGEGVVTRNSYNALGQLTDTVEAYGTPDAATTHYTYDGAGRVLTVTAAYGASEAATVTYAYDGLGNRTTVTDARGNATTYTFDRLGQVLTRTNALAGVTTFVYDAFGQVVKITDPGGATTYNYYDNLGRLVTTRDPENYVTRTTYDRFGQAVEVRQYTRAFTSTPRVGVNPAGDPDKPAGGPSPSVIAAYAYATQLQADADAAASALAAEMAAVLAAKGTPLAFMQNMLADLQAHRAVVQAQYDAANFLDRLLVYGPQLIAIDIDISLVNNNITRLNYGQGLDSWGQDRYYAGFNVPALQTAYNNAQAAASQALAEAQQLEFAEQIDSFGAYARSTATYDRLGRVKTRIDAKGYGESYAYNAFGDLVRFRRYPGAITGATYNETLFEYDNRGSLEKTTDAEGFFESYTYDAFARRITSTAKSYVAKPGSGPIAAGGTTTYAYDKNGRLTSELLPIQGYDSTGAATGYIGKTYTYDRRGNLIATATREGATTRQTTTYTYDKLDRRLTTAGDSVSGVTIDASTKAVSTVSGAPTETVTYDANGNVIRIVDAAGSRTVFFYDQLNRKTVEISALGTYTAYTYDADGNVTRVRIYETAVTVPANGGTSSAAPAAPSGSARATRFDYDGLGRVLTARVELPSGYKTGTLSGINWDDANTTTLNTTYRYDYLGNVVRVADPNGNETINWYDELGRKTAQLDAEGYLTAWTYNSEGNVLTERRYSTRFTGTHTDNLPSIPTNAADRVTTYTYDKVGNRLSEARSGVVIHNGSGGTSTVTSTISYVYNGLGQVTRKTEATGDQFDYAYDAGGRLMQETRPIYASNSGANVTPQLNYYYDGLGGVVRTVQAAGGDAVQRVTTYAYGAGGRLSSMTDAEGNVHSYIYDVAGRLVMEYYSRSGVTEGIGYRYDALGRSLGQGYYLKPGSSWNFQSANQYTTIAYNAFGDVTGIAFNRTDAEIASRGYQQESKYDLAGRMWATNSGDGVWKYFGYDKNGNQTLAITGAGEAMGGYTFEDILDKISESDVNATYTAYNERNLATSVLEEGRQLSDSSTRNLTTARTYNAFGEVASETDAAGATITYSYNTMGRMIRSESPTVQIMMNDGTSRYVKPSEDYYYDASGRLVATRDANGTYATGGGETTGTSKAANTGNLTRMTLLAGTGYGGSEALVSQQMDAGGGTTETLYDIHGDARTVRTLLESPGTWRTDTQMFDRLGRLIRVTHANGLIDSYAYDALGQRIKHGNNEMSTLTSSTLDYLDGNIETTDYDIQGRITKTRAFGGDTTEYTFTWDGTLEAAGTGLVDTGGWIEEARYKNTLTAAYLTSIEKDDLFGHVITRTDLDGRLHNFEYNAAGWLTKTYNNISGYAEINYSYYNTALIRGEVGNAPETHYEYDAAGRRVFESVAAYNWQAGIYENLKQATVSYDKLGRMLQFEDQGGPDIPYAKLVYAYDAAGNVMATTSTTSPLDLYGNPGTQVTVTKYNRYDAMNRMVLTDGIVSGGAIVRGTAGTGIAYDIAGQRASATFNRGASEVVESYTYDGAGSILARKESVAGGAVTLRSSFTYDKMGRLKTQKDYVAGSTTSTVFDKTVTYNAKGQVSFERTYTLVGSNTMRADATYTYLDYDGNYALGQVGKIDTINYKNNNDGNAADTLLQYRYDLYELATISQQIYKPDKSSSTTYYNNYQLDPWGYTHQVDITDGRSRKVIIKHDENNQIVSREEDENSYNRGNPRQIYYRFEGKQLGEISNDSTQNVDYQVSVNRRTATPPTSPGPFLGGSLSSTPYSDFNQHYDAVNSFEQSSSSRTGYTAQGGETLQQVAAQVWGDASLWYEIAQANGLSGAQPLAARQILLTVIAIVWRSGAAIYLIRIGGNCR